MHDSNELRHINRTTLTAKHRAATFGLGANAF